MKFFTIILALAIVVAPSAAEYVGFDNDDVVGSLSQEGVELYDLGSGDAHWFLQIIAQFTSVWNKGLKYVCMFAYTFLIGCNILENASNEDSSTKKYISVILASAGGGVLVDILTNTTHTWNNDAYWTIILISLLLHAYVTALRDFVKSNFIFEVSKLNFMRIVCMCVCLYIYIYIYI